MSLVSRYDSMLLEYKKEMEPYNAVVRATGKGKCIYKVTHFRSL